MYNLSGYTRTYKIKYSRVVTGPEVEPITLNEAKIQCKIEEDFTLEDDLLTLLIQAARELVEDTTNRSLITQERVIKFDQFPCTGSLYLTHGLLQTVEAVKYFDEDEVEQTIDSANYWIDNHGDIPRIVIKDSWPATKCMPNAVTVECTCGYGDAATDVPKPLVQSVKVIVAALYEHRGDDNFSMPELANCLMRPYIVTQNAWY